MLRGKKKNIKKGINAVKMHLLELLRVHDCWRITLIAKARERKSLKYTIYIPPSI